MQIVTLSEVKVFLEKTDSEHDKLLMSYVDMVSKRVETYLGRSLDKAQRTIYCDAGSRLFYLPAYPIDTSSALTVVLDGTTQTVDSDYYVWEDSGLIEFYTEPTYVEPKQIQITWTGGYESGKCPSDMKLATLMQIALMFRRRNQIGVTSISYPDGSTSYNVPLKLLPEVIELLKPYKHFRAAG